MLETMRIGFDARAAFLDPRRGLGRVARSLADALLEAAPGEVVVFVSHGARVPQTWYPRAASIVQLSRPRRGAFLFDPMAWAITLRRHRVDVLHLPAWGVPPGVPVPTVATFHDATPFRFPSPPERWRRWRSRLATRSLARATAVHAVSHHAARELREVTAVPESRVSVIHHGVDAAFVPGAAPEPPRHILFVGGADPHKNLDVVLDILPEASRRGVPPLVVAGPPAAGARLLAHAGLARLVPDPDDVQLALLYRQALALLVPSRSEGFGLTIAEAMACGCPVIAADAGALPEVCGGAAVLVDPDDRAGWLEAVGALAASPDRRRALAAAGLGRAREFTGRRAAAGLLDLYRRVARRDSS